MWTRTHNICPVSGSQHSHDAYFKHGKMVDQIVGALVPKPVIAARLNAQL